MDQLYPANFNVFLLIFLPIDFTFAIYNSAIYICNIHFILQYTSVYNKIYNEVFLRVMNHTGQAEKNPLGPAGIRTRDLRFTSPMLYQLDYRSIWELVVK